MERTEILNEIKDAEADNSTKKAECETECRKIASDAETGAKEISKAAEAKRRKYREEALAACQKEIAGKKSAILTQGEQDAKALVERTSNKLDKVITSIVTEFERAFDV